MDQGWRLRCPPPRELVRPVPVDPAGVAGPTAGKARGPRWRRSSPGLYVPSTVAGTVEQRVLEASYRLPSSGVVTGWAALRLHGCGYLDGRGRDGRLLPVPLTVPVGVHLRALPGTVVRRGRLDTDEVVLRHGVPCTAPDRTLFDAARTAPTIRESVVLVDTAAAAGVVDLPTFTSYAVARPRWPGAAQVREACALAVTRSMSPYETRLRLVWVLDARLPPPLCNWPVTDADGRRLGRPDIVCPRLGTFGEFDGAGHRTRRQHAVDVARWEAFTATGLEGFVAVGHDVERPQVLVARMHAAVERARSSRRPRTFGLAQDPGPL